MAIHKIVTVPDPVLTTKSQEISEITSEVIGIIKDLKDTLEHSKYPGAGLAANQIGINKQICVVRHFHLDPANKEKEIFEELVLINPVVTSDSNKTYIDWEGCLSVPDTYGLVSRYKKVKVLALDEKGNKVKFTADGFFGRTIQHEVDHLNGVVFTQKVIGTTKTEKELDELFTNSKTKLA